MDREDLETLMIELSGRENLWGKTKQMFLRTEQLSRSYDWVLKVHQLENLPLTKVTFPRLTMILSYSWRT